MNTIRDFTVKNPTLDTCSFQIYIPRGNWGDFSQCSRNYVEIVEGFHFCKQHARKVKAELGILESSSTIFIVENKDSICQIYGMEEGNMFYYSNHRDVFGNNYQYYGTGKVNKKYLRWFSTLDEAITFCIQKIKEYQEELENLTYKSHQNISKLEEMRTENA